jgi:hypothetical protein
MRFEIPRVAKVGDCWCGGGTESVGQGRRGASRRDVCTSGDENCCAKRSDTVYMQFAVAQSGKDLADGELRFATWL